MMIGMKHLSLSNSYNFNAYASKLSKIRRQEFRRDLMCEQELSFDLMHFKITIK